MSLARIIKSLLRKKLLGEPQRISRHHVVWAYRLFLDREPESEAPILQKLSAWGTTQELRTDFMTSPEFRAQNPGLGFSVEPNVVIKELDAGLRLFVDLSDVIIGRGIILGEYERGETAFVRRMVRPGMTVLDIGAHIGYFTIIMAALAGPSGHVCAFEPFNQAADLLERSVTENRFETRVSVERAAVSSAPGTGRLIFLRRTLNSGGSYLGQEGTDVPTGHEVKDVRLIALDHHPLRRPVSFIKVDVEGSEPLVFRGAKMLLSEDRPVILSELHPGQMSRVSGITPSEFIAEMSGRGYDCRSLGSWTAVRGADRLRSVVFFPKETHISGKARLDWILSGLRRYQNASADARGSPPA